MPTSTYTPLANITLGSAATSITFSSISQSYRDLILVANFTGTVDGETGLIRFNSDSGSNYTMVGMRGNGSSAASYTISTTYGFIAYAGGFVGGKEISISQIFDYSATDKHKTWLVRSDNAGSKSEAMANRWASTSAITSFSVFLGSGNISTGSTFALYGIAS